MTQIIETGKEKSAILTTGINHKRLDGKIAVVTGGNSGIGLATAQRFVEEGAFVFITADEIAKAVLSQVSNCS